MAVDNTNTIDLIGVDNKTGVVILTISDHLNWEETNIHLGLLQDKINCYLRFIESGEIYETYPMAKDKKMVISVVKKHSLSKEGEDFINRAKKIVNEIGIGLESVYLQNQ